MFSKLTWWRSTFDSALLRILIVCFLLALSLVPRFYRLVEEAPQPDELHWLVRSNEVLKLIKAGDYRHATTYTSHPGVPPELAMAASRTLFDKFDKDGPKIDALGASRIACSALSALSPVFIFLGFAPMTGTLPALIGGVALALDPHHIGISRQAHLDGSMSLFVLLTVLCYYRGITKKSARWYVLAGIAWGFSILTKPPAVLLIPAILLWKAIEKFCARNSQVRLIDPMDFLVVLVGHMTLAGLYTRLWDHRGELVRRWKIESRLADGIYDFGMKFQSHPSLVTALLAGVAAAGAMYFFGSQRRRRQESDPALPDGGVYFIIVMVLAAALMKVPQVLESIIRYWYWVFGLSHMDHRAYGEVHLPPLGGYLFLFLTRMPALTVITFMVGAAWCLLDLRDRLRRHDHGFGRGSPGLFTLAVLLSWGVFLSISPKQALRYLLPAVTCAMIVSGLGWAEIGAWLFEPVRPDAGRGSVLRRKLAWPSLFVLITGLSVSVFQAYPNYLLYFNWLSGGIETGVRRQSSMPATGHLEAVSYLRDRAEEAGHGLTVGVYGDLDLLKFVYNRYFPSHRYPLRFIFTSTMVQAQYLVVFPFARTAVLGSVRDNLTEVYKYSVGGIVFIRLYKVLPFNFTETYKFRLDQTARTTGRLIDVEPPAGRVLRAAPKEDKKGFLFGDSVHASAGTYRFDFDLGVPQNAPLDPALAPDRYAVRVEAGKDCSRIVTLAEIQQPVHEPVRLDCTLISDRMVNVRVYWFGSVPVELAAARVAAEPPVQPLSPGN